VPYGPKIVWCRLKSKVYHSNFALRGIEIGVTRAAEGVAVEEVCDECVAVETTPVPFGLGCECETWPGR
jgi:hypothetical protein